VPGFSLGDPNAGGWQRAAFANPPITAQGLLTERDRNTPVTITGGTGAY
jgi:hypothetical protein